jgi:predicted  nucleic acid-binding Zn-ribbon protein
MSIVGELKSARDHLDTVFENLKSSFDKYTNPKKSCRNFDAAIEAKDKANDELASAIKLANQIITNASDIEDKASSIIQQLEWAQDYLKECEKELEKARDINSSLREENENLAEAIKESVTEYYGE